MRISKRLLTICQLVPKNANVADIGADHGLVEKYLIENNIVNSIVAVENKIGPYSILKNALEGYDKVKLSLSDGIEDIDEETDTLILAGIGGINIINILSKNIDKLKNIKNIIVDPHRDVDKLIDFVEKIKFNIAQQIELNESNKNYKIILFRKEEFNEN